MKVQKGILRIFGLSICLFFCLNGLAQIPKNGLVGYYQLEGNAADSSLYGNHGSIIGDVIPTDDRFGEAGKACFFDGGYIDAGNPVAYQLVEELSISAWIKPNKINDWSALITKWAGFDVGGFYLGINPDNNSVRWNFDIPNPIDGNKLEIEEWTHIVSSYDGDTIKIYENGILVSFDLYEGQIDNVSANLQIGAQDGFPRDFLFYGAIDDVLIYERALAENEVREIFNQQITTPDVAFSGELTIYPNPTNGIIRLIPRSSEDIWYAVFNYSGKKILEDKFNDVIDLSEFNLGAYYLRLSLSNNLGTNNRIVTKKIILY